MTLLEYFTSISPEEKKKYPNIFCHDFHCLRATKGYDLCICKNCNYTCYILKNEYDLDLLNKNMINKNFCEEETIRKIIE